MNDNQEMSNRDVLDWLCDKLLEEYRQTGDFRVVHEFLESLDDYNREMSNRDVLDWLCAKLLEEYRQTGDSSVVCEFLESLDDYDRESFLRGMLWHALEHRDWALAEYCIGEGHSITLGEEDLSDPGPVCFAIYRFGDCPDVVEWLIQHGADVNRDVFFSTPLMAAARFGAKESTALLLQYGAHIDGTMRYAGEGFTPLMAAAQHGHKCIVEMLLAHGADVNRKTTWGEDAAYLAQQTGHREIADLLRKAQKKRHQ